MTRSPKRKTLRRYRTSLGGFMTLLVALWHIAAPSSAHATPFFWDGTTSTVDADGGDGIWDTTLTNWDTAATAGADTAWTNGNQAVFAGTAGTVTLGTAITVSGNTLGSGTSALYFGTSGYIVGGTNSISTTAASNFRLNNTTFQSGVSLGLGLNRTLTLDITGTTNSIAGVISGTGSSGLTINNEGTISISNAANTYTGQTQIGNNVGAITLRVTKLANLSENSSLGAPTTAANGVIIIGRTSNSGTLELVGGTTQSVTNRQIRIGGNQNGSGTATIVNNNTDPLHSLVFTNAAFNLSNATTSSTRTLNLRGSNTGDNEIQGAIINNADNVGVTVSGTGHWILSGDNTYDNVTTVTASATLTLSGNNSGATGGVTATTAGTGSTTPRLNINSATALGGGTLTFGGGAGTDTVRLDNTSLGLVSVSTNNAFALNRNFTFIGTQSLDLGNMTTTLGGLITGSSRFITVTANTLTFGGPIGEAVVNLGISKFGAGTLVFSGDNTYSGATAVSNTGSILNIRHANALGATTAGTSVGGTATLQLQGGISFAAEALSLTSHNSSVATPRLQSVSGNNTWNGTITTTGTASLVRIFSDADLLTLAGTITGGDANTEFSLQGAGNITVTGQITGPSGLSSNSGATPTTIRRLSNDTNDYTGQTRAVGGVLEFTSVADGGVASALGAGTTTPTIALGSGTSDAVLRYAGTAGGGHTSNRVINLSGTTGAVSIEASGAGALVFNGTNTATGAGSKTLTLGGTNTGDNSIGAIVDGSGTTALTKAGAGKWILSGANTYTGTTTVNAGTLELTGGAAIADTGAVVMADVATAILKLNNNETIGSLSGGGTTGGDVNLQGNTLTVGDATDTTYAGDISGTASGSLTKQGVGTLILTGANTYDGATTVSNGELFVNGDQSGAIGAVTVGSGAFLGGTGTIGDATTVTTIGDGATISAGSQLNNATFDNLSFNGGLNVGAASGTPTTWLVDLVGGTGADRIDVVGALNLTDTNLSVNFSNFTFGESYIIASYGSLGGTGTFLNAPTFGTEYNLGGSGLWIVNYADNGNFITLTAVPEPGTFGLLGLALAGLAFLRFRKRREEAAAAVD